MHVIFRHGIIHCRCALLGLTREKWIGFTCRPIFDRLDSNIETMMMTSPLTGGLTADEFKMAFRHHPAGVAVITADIGNGPVGLTASSVFSVSADPAVLVFSLSADASAAPTILNADAVVVHMLLADQLDLAKLCATSGVDRFADTSLWDRLPTGEPYFKNVQARIRGRIINKMPIGNSTVVAVHALEAYIPDEEPASNPLVYHNRSWHHLGEHSKL